MPAYSTATSAGRAADLLLGSLPEPRTRYASDPDHGGLMGALGGFVSGGVDLFTGALQLIDLPRSFVVSTVNETADLVSGDGFSVNDWGAQILDGMSFSEAFPSVFETDFDGGWGNDILQRAKQLGGFAGDVLLDPFTWVGAPGAGTLARGGAKKLSRALAVDSLPGTNLPEAALRHAVNQGDTRASQFAKRLERYPTSERTGRAAERYLRTQTTYADDVENAILTLADRGGGAAGIADDALVETLVGERTSGLRLRLNFLSKGGIPFVSQARWERITRPVRQARGAIAESRLGLWVADKTGHPFIRMAEAMYYEAPGPLRIGALKFIESSRQAIRASNRWGTEMQGEVTRLVTDLGNDKAKGLAVVELLESGIFKYPKNGPPIARSTSEWSGEARKRLDTALNTLGGKDEAMRIVGEWKAALDAGWRYGVEQGKLKMGRLDSYFPMMTASGIKTILADVSRAGYDPTVHRRVQSAPFGVELPVVTEALHRGDLTIKDGEIWDWVDADWATYKKEFEEAGKAVYGEDWINTLEQDPFKAMYSYFDAIRRRSQERMVVLHADQTGMGELLDTWKQALDFEETIPFEKLGEQRQFAREAARVVAKQAETKRGMQLATAASDLLENATDHPAILRIRQSGASPTLMRALERLYWAEFYGAINPEKYKSIFADNQNPMLWVFDEGGAAVIAADPALQPGNVARAAHAHAQKAMKGKKRGNLPIDPDALPLDEHVALVGELLDNVDMKVGKLLIESGDRDSQYKAVVRQIDEIEAKQALEPKKANDYATSVAVLRSLRDRLASVLVGEQHSQIFSPWRINDIVPTEGFAVIDPNTVLRVPDNLSPEDQMKQVDLWRNEFANIIDAGGNWVQIGARTDPGRPPTPAREPLYPPGGDPKPVPDRKNIITETPPRTEAPTELTPDDVLTVPPPPKPDEPELIIPPPEVKAKNFEEAARMIAAEGRYPAYDAAKREVKPSQLKLDAAKYQFKRSSETGAVYEGGLGAVKRWSRKAAKVGVVVEELDGTLAVVDGHQRINLWNRLQASGANPPDEWDAIVLRESDGWTPELSRLWAAEANVIEGSGTDLDWAKLIRTYEKDEYKALLDQAGDISKDRLKDVHRVTGLADEVFTAVADTTLNVEKFELRYARTIAAAFPDDPPAQMAVFRALLKSVNDDEVASMVDADQFVRSFASQVKQGVVRTDTVTDSLFGEEVTATFDFALHAALDKALLNNAKFMGSLKKRAAEGKTILEGAGGTTIHADNLRAAAAKDVSVAEHASSLAMYSKEYVAFRNEIAQAIHDKTLTRKAGIEKFVKEATKNASEWYDIAFNQAKAATDATATTRAVGTQPTDLHQLDDAAKDEATTQAMGLNVLMDKQNFGLEEHWPGMPPRELYMQRARDWSGADWVRLGGVKSGWMRRILSIRDALLRWNETAAVELLVPAGEHGVFWAKQDDLSEILAAMERAVEKEQGLSQGDAGLLADALGGQLTGNRPAMRLNVMSQHAKEVRTQLYEGAYADALVLGSEGIEGTPGENRLLDTLRQQTEDPLDITSPDEIFGDEVSLFDDVAPTAWATDVEKSIYVEADEDDYFGGLKQALAEGLNRPDLARRVTVTPFHSHRQFVHEDDFGEIIEALKQLPPDKDAWSGTLKEADLRLFRDDVTAPILRRELIGSDHGELAMELGKRHPDNIRPDPPGTDSTPLPDETYLLGDISLLDDAAEDGDDWWTPQGDMLGMMTGPPQTPPMRVNLRPTDVRILQEAKLGTWVENNKVLIAPPQQIKAIVAALVEWEKGTDGRYGKAVLSLAEKIARWTNTPPGMGPDALRSVGTLVDDVPDDDLPATLEGIARMVADSSGTWEATELEAFIKRLPDNVGISADEFKRTVKEVGPSPQMALDEAPVPDELVVLRGNDPMMSVPDTTPSPVAAPKPDAPPPRAPDAPTPEVETPDGPLLPGREADPGLQPWGDAEIGLATVYPTLEAAQQAAESIANPSIIDLSSNTEIVAGGIAGWKPSGRKLRASTKRSFADRMIRLRVSEDAKRAARQARNALGTIPDAPPAEEVVGLLRNAQDDGAAWGAGVVAANRYLEDIEASYRTAGTALGIQAADAVREFRTRMVKTDADNIMTAAAVGGEAVDSVRVAQHFADAVTGETGQDVVGIENFLNIPFNKTAAAVQATTERSVALGNDAGWGKLLGKLSSAKSGEKKDKLLREAHDQLAELGAEILNRSDDLTNSLTGRRPQRGPLDLGNVDILETLKLIDDAEVRLIDDVAVGFKTRMKLTPEAGAPVGPFATLAEMQVNIREAAQAWRINLARVARAVNPSETNLEKRLNSVRLNRLTSTKVGSRHSKVWKELDEKGGNVSEWFTAMADRIIKADATVPKWREEVAELAAEGNEAAKSAQKNLDDWSDLRSAASAMIGNQPTDPEKAHMQSIVDIISMSLVDNAKFSMALNDPHWPTQRLDELDRYMAQANKVLKSKAKVRMLEQEANWKLREFSDQLYAPEQLVEALEGLQVWKDPGKVFSDMGRVTAAWRGLATLSFGFHVRNLIGGFWMNAMNGVVGPKPYMEFTDAYSVVMKGKKDPGLYNADEQLVEALFKRGDIGWGQFKDEIPQVAQRGNFGLPKHLRSWMPLAGALGSGKQFVPVAANRELGGRVEDLLRGTLAMATYKKARQEGMGHDGALSLASGTVDRFHFDYSDLSDFERKAKVAIPFYVWMSRNFALQIDMMGKMPQYALNANRLYETIGDGHPDNPFVPAYYDRNRYVKLGQRSYFTLELPFTAAAREARLSRPWPVIGSTNPLFIKGPIELAFGRDTYRGYDLPATEMFKRQLENLVPASNRVVRPLEQWAEGDTTGALNNMLGVFGVPYREVTMQEMIGEQIRSGDEKALRYQQQQRQRRERERQSRRRGTERDINRALELLR